MFTRASTPNPALSISVNTWESGDLISLWKEAKALQMRLTDSDIAMSDDKLSRTFANHIFHGRINAAMRLLERNPVLKGGGTEFD